MFEDRDNIDNAIEKLDVWYQLTGLSLEQSTNLRSFMTGMLYAPPHVLNRIVSGQMEDWWSKVPIQGMLNCDLQESK